MPPLWYRANDTPRNAADFSQRRANFQRHAYAVAGIRRRAVERPAFLAGAVQKRLAHADVVLKTTAGDNHRAARVIGDALAVTYGDNTRNHAIVVHTETFCNRLVMNRNFSRLYTRQQAGVKCFAGFFQRFGCILGIVV